jgi:hypothetical protein
MSSFLCLAASTPSPAAEIGLGCSFSTLFLTCRTLRDLTAVFDLGHADSARNRTRRVARALPVSSKHRQDIAAIRHELLKTERS